MCVAMRLLQSIRVIVHVYLFLYLRFAFSECESSQPPQFDFEVETNRSQTQSKDKVTDASFSIAFRNKVVKFARAVREEGSATNGSRRRLRDVGKNGEILRSQMERRKILDIHHRVERDRRRQAESEGETAPVVSRWLTWEEWSACSRDCGNGVRYRIRGCYPELGKCSGLPMMEELCENECFDSSADTEGILGSTRGKVLVVASVLSLLVVVRILVILRKSGASAADDQAEWRAAAVRAGDDDEERSLVSSGGSTLGSTTLTSTSSSVDDYR